MFGVGPIVAMLILSAIPELPGIGTETGAETQPEAGERGDRKRLPSIVDVGRKWGIVTSLKRSPAHNRAVGGVANSYHLHGRAIDIARRPGVRHADVAAAYRKAGYALIESLDEGDHSHFAFGRLGDAPATAPVEPTEIATAEPACPSPGDPNFVARRRPDRSDGCAFADEPKPRLRPLEQPAP